MPSHAQLSLVPSHDKIWVPLFPLNTVLFPGGMLPLKVFETRYIDMVRDCLRREVQFGVVLIKSGQETGMAAQPEPVGCLARIAQWDMEGIGILLLRTQGDERFRILETRVLSDERLEARIELLPKDIATPISDMHVRCAAALKIVIKDVEARGRAQHGATFESPFALPLQFDESGWIANRWCEILPIPLKARQKLLELDDAQSRLSIIYRYLQQHKIIA